jgi:predicted NUDIX family NTP pyrophosphohydrolase
MYRLRRESAKGEPRGLNQLEIFLAHPGGPLFAKKDDGWWTIPKGVIEGDDDPLDTAIREFAEETGLTPPRLEGQRSEVRDQRSEVRSQGSEVRNESAYIPLGEITQKGGKVVHAWAFEGDVSKDYIVNSNTFMMEWPPKSSRERTFPEVDRAEFFDVETARLKVKETQIPFIDRLVDHLRSEIS